MYRFIILLLMACFVFYSCEGCPKDYTITGIVTDEALNRLPAVEIQWHSTDPNQPAMPLGTTDSQGVYSIPLHTLGSLVGEQLEFVKPGYVISVADPFTVFEASSDICGGITVRRDAILQLQ